MSRKASGWTFNDGHAEAALPRVMSAPMGWSNIVDFIQSGLERMGTLAGMPANQVIKMGEPLPALPLDTPRDYFSFYVDNWDQLKVIARSSRAVYEGTPSDHQLRRFGMLGVMLRRRQKGPWIGAHLELRLMVILVG